MLQFLEDQNIFVMFKVYDGEFYNLFGVKFLVFFEFIGIYKVLK